MTKVHDIIEFDEVPNEVNQRNGTVLSLGNEGEFYVEIPFYPWILCFEDGSLWDMEGKFKRKNA